VQICVIRFSRLSCSHEFRKSIAVVLTVYNQTQKAKLRQDFKNKTLKPLDLRRKLTRAFRKRLAPKYAAAQKVRAQKRAAYFPTRTFAIKA
jgi:large subunit ribosomal protein L35e